MSYINNFKYIGNIHIWDVENNIPLCKEDNINNQLEKSNKSITNIIYNKIRSTLAICYVDNTVTLQSFGPQNSEQTVCNINIYDL